VLSKRRPSHEQTNVKVLKLHLPYHESDHVLAQAMNLYVGGSCIEDMALLQHDEAAVRMLGGMPPA